MCYCEQEPEVDLADTPDIYRALAGDIYRHIPFLAANDPLGL